MCKDCDARRKMMRDALFSAKLRELAVHAISGSSEIIGLKEKTGQKELKSREAKPRDGKVIPALPVNRP